MPTVGPVTDSRGPRPGVPDGARGTARTEPLLDGLLTGTVGPDDDDGADGLGLDFTSPAEGVLVATVTGELDMLTAPQFRQEVLEHAAGATLVVLALDGVSFLGTSGLAALIELREQAHRSGTELRLACTERKVLRPIGIAGLHHLFDIHDDVTAALES